MLYIFQVDLGCMLTFELNLSLESVSTLKNAITAKCNIAFDNQVLLISGGDYLEDNCPVHQYNGAGTVSNPIYLFNKSAIMSPEQYSFNQPQTQTDQIIEAALKQIQLDYKSTLEMDASLKTIVARTELAKKLNQLTTEFMSNCEQLIRDQHFMYQGWQAVIANLDDVACSFVEHVKSFEEQLKVFLTKREYYHQKLKNFKSDLELLNQIKILPSLHADSVSEIEVKCDEKSDRVKPIEDEIEEENKENVEANDGHSDETKSDKVSSTLMSLINQNAERNCLEKVSVYCKTMLEQFTESLLDRVKDEMSTTIKTIEENKKIKKIESRLYNLDLFLINVRQHVEDQNLLTLALIQNQNSANTYNDPTIFSDLCGSHKTQLDLMLKYLNKAMTIRKKFQNSKRELTYILLARLKTIMICETELNSLNWRVLLYSESLKKLKRSLEVVDQINLAPKVYFGVFQEVNRRNKFDFFFNLWSKFIVQVNSKLIEKENLQRTEFRKQFSTHFLKSFFPKFDDNVPDFAVNLPDEYDQSIPLISEQEFSAFIERNKQFDSSLGSEDNFLNAFVCRMNNNMKNDKMNDENVTSITSQINENVQSNLIGYVDSLFPVKQTACNEVEEIKKQLNEEYEIRLKELRKDFEIRFEEQLSKLSFKTNDDLAANSITNNIACDGQSTADPSINHINSQQPANRQNELPLFFNCRKNLFKNLISELLSMKYSDYIKDNETNLSTSGPSFISFVETIFTITWPSLR